MKRWIDENGKLFHRINVLDAILLLIVVAVAVFGVFKFVTMDKLGITKEYAKGEVTFRIHSLSQHQVDAMREGDLVSYVKYQKFGHITSIDVEPRKDLVNSNDGKTYYIDNPAYYTVTFTVQNDQCFAAETGFYLDRSYQVREGQHLDVSTGLVAAEAVVLQTKIFF